MSDKLPARHASLQGPDERAADDFDLSAALRTVLSHPLTVLAGLSVYSYFVVLTRAWIYCAQFGIPLNWVPPISRSAWVFTFGLLLLGATGFVFFFASYALTGQDHFLRIRDVIVSAFFFFCLLILGVRWRAALYCMVMGWLLLVWGRDYWRKKKREYFDIQGRVRRDKLSAWTRLQLKWGVTLVVGVFFLAALWGYAIARTRRQFPVLAPQAGGEPELVVLYSDSEQFICAPFQRQKRETERTFVLLDQSQISQERRLLQVEPIGPLHPVPLYVPMTRQQLLKLVGQYIRRLLHRLDPS